MTNPQHKPSAKKRGALTEADWDDVADLCHEAAQACEIAYENHTKPAKKKAAEWLMRLALRANALSAKAKNRKSS